MAQKDGKLPSRKFFYLLFQSEVEVSPRVVGGTEKRTKKCDKVSFGFAQEKRQKKLERKTLEDTLDWVKKRASSKKTFLSFYFCKFSAFCFLVQQEKQFSPQHYQLRIRLRDKVSVERVKVRATSNLLVGSSPTQRVVLDFWEWTVHDATELSNLFVLIFSPQTNESCWTCESAPDAGQSPLSSLMNCLSRHCMWQ